MITRSIDGAVVAGGMRAFQGSAAFASADVVLRWPETGEILVARSWRQGDGLVAGHFLSPEEWQALLGQDEALELSPEVPAEFDCRLWVVRPDNGSLAKAVARRLEDSSALVGASAHSGALALVVREPAAKAVRSRVRDERYDEGRGALRSGRLVEALRLAEEAFLVEARTLPETLALYVFCLSRSGQYAEADAWVASFARSHGASFREEVIARVRDLGHEEPILERGRPGAPRGGWFRKGRRDAVARSLEDLVKKAA
jgi:hypothetical protein